MSTMRVRELSAELGVSNKELLHMLREDNVPVKSHMSGLTEEQAERVRQRLRSGSGQQASQSKVTSSGVIVRRRRRDKGGEQKPPAEEQAEKSPGSESAREEPSAESSPRAESPTQSEAQQEQEALADGPAADESLSTSPTTDQQDMEQVTPRTKRRKRSRKKPKKAEHPSVTVISRPETAEPVSPSQEQEAPSEQVVDQEASPVQESAPSEDKPQKVEKKKGKKGKEKRTVDVSTLYDEQEVAQEPLEKPKKSEGKKGKRTRKQPGKKKPAPATAAAERPGKAAKEEPRSTAQPQKAAKRKIRMEEAIRVSDLAQEMGVKGQQIIKSLMDLGIMATINQSLDLDTASIIASEYGYEVEKTGFSEEQFLVSSQEDSPEELQPRPPVVTIMGHVDHGKTSLLDGIRESHIMDKEAGGITQHIGAYYVNIRDNTIVFLDTPGHEAFTEMRSRGAQVTDIVILIVAADDGVMDQTREAINHAKAAGVPLMVAVNKVDKNNADPERVKRELAEQGLVPEEWGGDTIFTYISAKQREGLDQVLEMILLQSEVLELQANPNKRAKGHIVEAKLDKGRGPVATVLVQEGTLRAGDSMVCGLHHGRVRALFNDRGQKIESAGPSMPVEVQGLDGVPYAGDEFVVVEEEKVAKRIAESRQQKQREKELAKESKVTLESFFKAKEEKELKNLNLVVKADVQGSLEAAKEALNKLTSEEVRVKIIHGGIGGISESDIKLASASDAVLVGFNVRPTAKIREIAEKEGVDIRYYSVIYHLVNEIKEAMAGMLSPVYREVYLGQAEVRETFSIPKVGTVAGCYILDGKLQRHANVRLLRDGVVIQTSKLDSLKRFKENAKEVSKGFECGASLAGYNDIKVGDIIEAYTEVQERPSLD